MRIPTNCEIEIETSEIATAIKADDLGDLISKVSEKAENMGYTNRRNFALRACDGMSENGLRLLAEILAQAHAQSLREEQRAART